MIRWNGLPIIFILLMASAPTVAADFVMTTGAREPYSNVSQTGYLDRVAIAVFGRLGHRVEVRSVPPARSINEAVYGRSDGDMQRIDGLEDKYPSLVQVPERINIYHFAGFALEQNVQVSTWDDLVNMQPGYMLGWKYYEARVPEDSRPIKIASPDQLFQMLGSGRLNIVLFDLYGGHWWAKQVQVKAWPVRGPFASLDMYMYLHKKNRELAKPLARAVRQLEKEGIIEAIRLEALPGYEKIRMN